MSNASITMSNLTDHTPSAQPMPLAREAELFREPSRDQFQAGAAECRQSVRQPYAPPRLALHATITALTGDVEIDFGTS